MKKIHLMQKIEYQGLQMHDSQLNISMNQNNQGNSATSFIQLNNFITAIEMVMNDVKLDPYILTYKLLLTFYSGVENINMRDFRQFFNRFESYFPVDHKKDIEIFINEVELFKRKDDLIDIKEIASLIKNDVDMFPR